MTDQDITVKVSDFTTIPGARHRSDGDGSAQEFFEDHLEPVLDDHENTSESVTIDFDGTWGYASSFISELALLLVKRFKDKQTLEAKISVKTLEQPGLEKRFWEEVDSADEESES